MKRVITDVNEEYQALRQQTGLVDYLGMGRYAVTGAGAGAFLNHVVTRTVDFLLEGQVSNGLLLRPDGTIVAEALVHCQGEDYLVEVWPEQAAAAGAHLAAAAADHADVTVTDLSDASRVLGIEGPESFRIAAKFLPFPVASMAYNSFVTTTFDDSELLVSRTGVTGEYGFKLHVASDAAGRLRQQLLGAGAREVGVDALDICRMESRFVNLECESGGDGGVLPSEIGLQWMVDLNGEFVGADALRKAPLPQPRLPVCWQTTEETGEETSEATGRVPAPGTEVRVADRTVGVVTHAVWSPTLRRGIGTARVERDVAASGLEFTASDLTVRSVSAPFLVATSFGVTME